MKWLNGYMAKWFLVIALLFGVGFLRTYQSYSSVAIPSDETFRAVVIRPPQAKGLYQRLEVKVEENNHVLRVITRARPAFRYGDLLEIKSATASEETGNVSSTTLSFPSLKLVERQRGNPIYQKVYTFREQLLVRIDSVLPEPPASLLAGIVFGIERSLGEDLDRAFREAGLVHIIVASGFNVTIVIGYLAKLLPWLGRKVGFVLIVGGVAVYAVLAGLDPPIVRAAIMGLETLLAVVVGRKKQALLWLLLSATIMLLVSPLLYSSLSFQMSFLATLALVLFQKRIQKYLYFFPKLIREDAATTLAVQIFILPLTWFVFGEVAPASILVNTLTLWTIAYIMPLGMLAAGIAFFNPTLGWLVALPASFMLEYIVWIVKIFT